MIGPHEGRQAREVVVMAMRVQDALDLVHANSQRGLGPTDGAQSGGLRSRLST